MGDVTFVGRHDHHGQAYQGGADGWAGGEQDGWLDLQQAAAAAGTSVEELKRAIRVGELPAERRGWVRVHRGDLMDWLHRP